MFLLLILLQISFFKELEGYIYLISAILSAILMALSISAYRKRYVKKILLAIFAFASFTVYLSLESLEVFYPPIESMYTETVAASITLLVLILFFLAIIKK
ncbi:MAG: hypothetical protein ACPKPY_00895 [Nitrososphaeraceae archaeon]